MMNSFWKGMVTGAVVGGVLAVVLMPESGRKVADKAREKLKQAGTKLKQKFVNIDETDRETEDFVSSLVEKGKIAESDIEDFKKQLNKIIK